MPNNRLQHRAQADCSQPNTSIAAALPMAAVLPMAVPMAVSLPIAVPMAVSLPINVPLPINVSFFFVYSGVKTFIISSPPAASTASSNLAGQEQSLRMPTSVINNW